MRYRITIETDYANISSLLAIAQPGDAIRVEPLEDEKAVAPPKPRNNKRVAKPQRGWDSKQEARLLKLKAAGKTVPEIAAALNRSVPSVQSHFAKMQKLKGG